MTITKWALDPSHSEIQFKVKHLMITTVTGHFNEFSASAETEGDDFSTAKISFEAKTSSVDTNSEQRDGHIKSADFFDVETYPLMSFQSTKLEKSNEENHYKLLGNLTIKNVTKPVEVAVEFGGMEKDPWGNEKAGFTLNAKISRKDWDLNWNATLESGGLLLSDEIRIHCEIQVAKLAVAANV